MKPIKQGLLTLEDAYNQDGTAKAGAIHLLWLLMQERRPEQNISHTEPPSLEEHVAFVRRRPYADWLIVWWQGKPIGAVSATYRNEVGIQILRAWQGKGIGTRALRLFLNHVKPLPARPSENPSYYVANINPQNAASLKLFRALGFTDHQVTLALKEEKKHGNSSKHIRPTRRTGAQTAGQPQGRRRAPAVEKPPLQPRNERADKRGRRRKT
jgi:RimJ/RimL family protein N-acetyltransferase